MIQQATADTADGYGGESYTWDSPTDVATVWAGVDPVSGLESVRGMVLQAETTHLVRLRYRSGLTHDMRLKWGTRYLYFAGPPLNTGERDRELLVQCKEDV